MLLEKKKLKRTAMAIPIAFNKKKSCYMLQFTRNDGTSLCLLDDWLR